jgi:hypothetical protein
MRFQVSRGRFVAVTAGPLLPFFATLLWSKGIAADVAVPAVVMMIAAAAAFGWLLSLTQVIEISRDGIVLYRVNRVAWPDIVSAAPARVLGLPYIKLGRSSGRAWWWLPLFFQGATDVPSALEAFAPEDHPLKASFTSLRGETAASTTPNR